METFWVDEYECFDGPPSGSLAERCSEAVWKDDALAHGEQRYREGLLRAIPVLQRWVDTHETKYGGRDDMGRKALLRTCMDEIRKLAGGSEE